MKPISLAYYAAALFGPILYFCVLTNNTNETHPILVFVVCPILFAIAGWLSSAGFIMKARYKWTAWSVLAGLVEAGMLVFLV